MSECVDSDDRKEYAIRAAAERRDVWVSAAMASLDSGRHAQEAIHAADMVLDAFDAKFPEVVIVAASGSDPDHDDDEGDE